MTSRRRTLERRLFCPKLETKCRTAQRSIMAQYTAEPSLTQSRPPLLPFTQLASSSRLGRQFLNPSNSSSLEVVPGRRRPNCLAMRLALRDDLPVPLPRRRLVRRSLSSSSLHRRPASSSLTDSLWLSFPSSNKKPASSCGPYCIPPACESEADQQDSSAARIAGATTRERICIPIIRRQRGR